MISYKQGDYKNVLLGNSKTSTIAMYGCKLCSLAYMVQKSPVEVNEILKKAGAFFGKSGDLLNDAIAAKALGLQYSGIDRVKNNMPDWTPNIKEVDYSPAPGKQQHFVVRVTENGKRAIMDPLTGKIEKLNKYPFVSYRLFKK